MRFAFLHLRARMLRPGAVLLCLSTLPPHLGAPLQPLTPLLPSACAAQEPSRIGISVQPPVLWVPDVPPGREVSLPAPITVENRGSEPITCIVEPILTSTLGIRLGRGYVDIPDPTWCKPEPGTITLAAGEARAVDVTLLVPDDPCHYNRHWCVAFSVRTSSGGMLGAAAYPYAYVETVSLVEPVRPPEATGDARALSPKSPRGTAPGSMTSGAEPPETHPRWGCLVVTPGILEAGDVPIGSSSTAGSVTILNGLGRDILFEVHSIVPGRARLARRTLITPGYTWMRDTDWLRPGTRSLIVHAGKEARFEVEAVSPSDSTAINYRWEGFIAISGSDGSESLVRVRWRTTANPGENSPLIGRSLEGDWP